ncbi:MAG: glycoside hydrolase family 5 protein, partial [Lachnospiraceae bacterium]|nr:glycoside hydrolase family 5 protein [Lachnospiraceae bacterium]
YYSHYKSDESEITEESTSLITDEDFLSASGTEIVNRSGESIVLTGINLGGWLLQEYWMCPVNGDSYVEQWTYLETLLVLEERFGQEKTQELIEIYEDNWITEEDFQNIAEMGCNVVRIPFWYRNFMSDDEGTWIDEDFDNNPGFQRLDWAIEMAGKYGLYVILDMHGCPGGQSTDHCAGSARVCKLYDEETYQDIMEELWLAISVRYKDNPVVAAYDIMNEPEEQDYTGDSVMDDPRNQVYDRMIQAIRENGDNHIITVEATWTLDALPYPEDTDWENIVYQLHSYGDDVETCCETLKNYSETHRIPVYIGEFSDQSFFQMAGEMGISCTSWTYKGSGQADGTWFVYESNEVSAVDVSQDPYWLMKLKWGACLNTKYFDRL